MAINGSMSEATAVGRVVSVNEKGFKIEGAENWSNYSKYAVGIVPPAKGDTVSVTFDRQGFVRGVEKLEGGPAPIRGGSDAPGAASGYSGAAKERTITRLAVLKAAAEFAASKPQSKSQDVLAIAANWERWVLRSDDPIDDNADAF